ncbi:MAG: RHS repeat-associated core domain-containing protein, partial [Isosphaeraceae bacterium]
IYSSWAPITMPVREYLDFRGNLDQFQANLLAGFPSMGIQASSGTVSMRYLFGPSVNAILARTNSSGTTAWYLTNQLGSVTDVVNSSGTVIDHIVYDPFGNITTQTNASEGDRFTFAGMQYDSTTGLYYDHARYYDSAIGKFTSQDPKGFKAGDANLYRYDGNNPINRTDPSGTSWDSLGLPNWAWGWVGGSLSGTLVAVAISVAVVAAVGAAAPISAVTIITYVCVSYIAGGVVGASVSMMLGAENPGEAYVAGFGFGAFAPIAIL